MGEAPFFMKNGPGEGSGGKHRESEEACGSAGSRPAFCGEAKECERRLQTQGCLRVSGVKAKVLLQVRGALPKRRGHWGPGHSLSWGPVLWAVEWTAASLASAHSLPAPPPLPHGVTIANVSRHGQMFPREQDCHH